MSTITTRPIRPEEHDALGDPGDALLDKIFGPRKKPGVGERIAAGHVHPLLFGGEVDGALVCRARLEKDEAGWRIERAHATGLAREVRIQVDTQLLTSLAAACHRAGVRAFYVQGRRNVAEAFTTRRYVDWFAGDTEMLRATGLVPDPAYRGIESRIAAVRARSTLVPPLGWEELAADNLPAHFRVLPPAEGLRIWYRLSRGGTITEVTMRDQHSSPQLEGTASLSWRHGPDDVGVEATRDALTVLVGSGARGLWVHAPFVSALLREAPADLEIDPEEHERVRWWTSRAG